MPGVLYASRERGTRSCCCRRAIQACDDDLLPRVSCISITELQHELTPRLPLQRVWFRLARVTPHKGPVLAPWLPRNQSGVARPRTRTMAGYSDRCAGQCSSRDSGPASHVLTALEAIITFHSIVRTTSYIPPGGPRCLVLVQPPQHPDIWARETTATTPVGGGDFHWHMALGSRWELWLDWVCCFSADISAPGAAQRKSSRLLRTGVGEINRRGWKSLSATERQQYQGLGGCPESGKSGLACWFRNSAGCKRQFCVC